MSNCIPPDKNHVRLLHTGLNCYSSSVCVPFIVCICVVEAFMRICSQYFMAANISLPYWSHHYLCCARLSENWGKLGGLGTSRGLFYRAMICIVQSMLSQNVCLCICLSHASVLSKQLNISRLFFTIVLPHHSSFSIP